MADDAQRIRALAEGISDEQARWRPDPDSWSILEVVNHLFDEEQEDFRVPLDLALHRPADPRPRINPGAWVTERGYNERDLGESLGFSRCTEGVACLAERAFFAGLGRGLPGSLGADQGWGRFRRLGGTRSVAYASVGGTALGVYHAPIAAVQGGLRRRVVASRDS